MKERRLTMSIRTLFTAVVGLLFIAGLSLSQETASPTATGEPLLVGELSPEPLKEKPTSGDLYAMETPERRGVSRAVSSGGEMVTKIFMLKYFPADDMERLIADLFSINPDKVHSDSRSNRLIIQATQKQMNDIEALIEKLDVADSQLAGSQAVENLIYRVYMFEIPSSNQEMKSFSMILQASAKLSSTKLLGVAEEKGIQVSDFLVSNEENEEPDRKIEFLIQGKAPSNESVRQMVETIADTQIKELKWDDATFTSGIEAAHYSRLPEQVQKHIKKFLGEDIVTVGYWFGSSSVPGEVKAPVGPWMLRLELEAESDRELELRVDVEIPERNYYFERRLGRDERDGEILSNTVRAKIGKPIIIGYNRQSYGTRKMGAMVIIPETDQLDSSEQKTP
jgi:hypothetical protein